MTQIIIALESHRLRPPVYAILTLDKKSLDELIAKNNMVYETSVKFPELMEVKYFDSDTRFFSPTNEVLAKQLTQHVKAFTIVVSKLIKVPKKAIIPHNEAFLASDGDNFWVEGDMQDGKYLVSERVPVDIVKMSQDLTEQLDSVTASPKKENGRERPKSYFRN